MSFRGLSWYAAPQGSSGGDGSEERPWDLQSALGGRSEIEPGDIVWVRGGVYRLNVALECALQGTEEAPIEVRGDPRDARPILDFVDSTDQTALHVTGEHVWLRRLELTNSSTVRTSLVAGGDGDPRGTGILVESGEGVRLIDLFVHDFGSSLFESRPFGLEIYGCLFFNSYWDGPDRSHGPGLYLRNPEGAPRKRIENNCLFQHGRQGLQGFGSTPFANVDVVGNVFFNNGIADDGFHRNLMFGSAANGHRDVLIEENWAYLAPAPQTGAEFNLLGGVTGSEDLRLEGNVFAHLGRPVLKVQRANNETVLGNKIVGLSEFSTFDGSAEGGDEEFRERYPSNEYFAERPMGTWTTVRGDVCLPDAFERTGQLLAAVLNWDLAETVELDLTTAAGGALLPDEGQQVRVCSVQDPNHSVERTVVNNTIDVPMSGWTTKTPAGRNVAENPLPTTFPEFGTFLIQWDVAGEPEVREPVAVPDPGFGLSREAARAARIAAWQTPGEEERAEHRRERRRAWRAFRYGRGG